MEGASESWKEAALSLPPCRFAWGAERSAARCGGGDGDGDGDCDGNGGGGGESNVR